ncbi:MAG: DUF3500 domain-containing protein [Pseudomonadota bacterium]
MTEVDRKPSRDLTRRSALVGIGAASLAPALPFVTAAADTTPDALGPLLRERVVRWLDMLDEAQRRTARFDFDSATRRRWNYMLGARFANGLALENMTPPQKDAARDVLATVLSAEGLEIAENIMLQQDILRDELRKGSRDRNRERFSLQIYGTPSATEPWSWRWEGHHLTITLTMVRDKVVSMTPKAFSSEPNTVPSGPYRGMVVLENETLGRALYAELDGSLRRAATLRDRSYGNILLKPGQEDRLGAPEGLALGDMPQPQAEKLRRLLALYMTDHLAGPLAALQEDRLAGEDTAAIRFGWAGANREDESIYYRLQGAGFAIEFATLRGQPQHHHTVVHDHAHNFGDATLG